MSTIVSLTRLSPQTTITLLSEGLANSSSSNMRRDGRFFIIDPLDNESVFTYYSEFENHWAGQTYVEVIILVLIFIIGFLSNALILVIIFLKKRRINVTDIFIANLSFCDLLYTLTIPMVIIARISVHWVLGNGSCKLLIYSQFLSGATSILTMMMIGVDRYIVICKQSSSKPMARRFTSRVAWIIVVLVWLVALSLSGPLIVGITERRINYLDDHYVFCAILWPEGFSGGGFLIAMLTCLFLVPVAVISGMYMKILMFVRDTSRKLQPLVQNNPVQMRLLKMFVTLVVLFVIMWLPFFVVCFLILYTQLVTSTHFTVAVMMSLLNPCINPILYGYFNDSYRRGLKKLFFRADRNDSSSARQSMRIDPNNTVLNTTPQPWTGNTSSNT